MGNTENNGKEKRENEVRFWCKVKRFSYELYKRLSSANKITFYKLTCQHSSMTTNKQREDLFENLVSIGSHMSARKLSSLQELINVDKKEQYFSPLTSKEKWDYLSRF